jgi:hypothetical protein
VWCVLAEADRLTPLLAAVTAVILAGADQRTALSP